MAVYAGARTDVRLYLRELRNTSLSPRLLPWYIMVAIEMVKEALS